MELLSGSLILWNILIAQLSTMQIKLSELWGCVNMLTVKINPTIITTKDSAMQNFGNVPEDLVTYHHAKVFFFVSIFWIWTFTPGTMVTHSRLSFYMFYLLVLLFKKGSTFHLCDVYQYNLGKPDLANGNILDVSTFAFGLTALYTIEVITLCIFLQYNSIESTSLLMESLKSMIGESLADGT